MNGRHATAGTIEAPTPGRWPRLRMPSEPRRLRQDRLVKVTQLSARIDAQILLQDLP
jgi:hypothetical protein